MWLASRCVGLVSTCCITFAPQLTFLFRTVHRHVVLVFDFVAFFVYVYPKLSHNLTPCRCVLPSTS